MKQLRHTLFIGLNDKDTKKQVVSNPIAKRIIMQVCGDCTLTEVQGHYTHEDGTEVTEQSIRVELLFKADNEVYAYAKKLKKELNQESIALIKDYIESTLI